MANELLNIIRDLISKQGPLSVAAFMELALQHPQYGYYRVREPIGRSGDFITAPEVSQMFGEMIGLWCADVWTQMGKPARFSLVELGPGRGTLLQDALRATAKIAAFQEGMHLCLMESDEVLRQQQCEKLSPRQPHYIKSLAELPPQPTLMIANEFFDALPVRQFEKDFQDWNERMVTVAGEGLGFSLRPLQPQEMNLIPSAWRGGLPGTIVEISPAAQAFMREAAQHIVKHGGAVLVIDYGYVAASGCATLQAVSAHRRAEVLERPGEIDLTAHADFTALAEAAKSVKAAVAGPMGQGEFLKNLGIEIRGDQLKARATPEQNAAINAALWRLTDPAQMGDLFKAMAVYAPPLDALPGF
jgi:NADH dehydrogenase [ubiquinone] 1 alpha subcomplex assembly factor 7